MNKEKEYYNFILAMCIIISIPIFMVASSIDKLTERIKSFQSDIADIVETSTTERDDFSQAFYDFKLILCEYTGNKNDMCQNEIQFYNYMKYKCRRAYKNESLAPSYCEGYFDFDNYQKKIIDKLFEDTNTSKSR